MSYVKQSVQSSRWLKRPPPLIALAVLSAVSLPAFLLARSDFVKDTIYVGAMTLSVAIMVWAIRTHRPIRPLVWWLLAGALAVTLPGHFLSFGARWSLVAISAEPWKDLIFLSGYLLAVGACLLMIRQHGGTRDWIGVIDAAILVGGSAILAWTFVIHPVVDAAHATSAPILEWIWPIINVVMDLFLLFLLARLACAATEMTTTRKIVLATISVLLITDFVFLAMGAPEEPTALLRMGWLLTYILGAGAAVHPSMRTFGHTVRPESSPDRIRKLILTLTILAPIASAIESLQEGHVEQAFIFGLLVVLFFLLSFRIERMMRLVESAGDRAQKAAHKANALATDLAASEEKFRSLIQNATDAVLVLDFDSVVAYASPAIERILGIPPEEMTGNSGVAIVDERDVARVIRVRDELRKTAGARMDLELRMRHRDGSVRWTQVSATNLLHIPAVGGIVFNFRDVTRRKKLEDDLKQKAFYDSLTGLANRALIRDRAEHALRQADRTGSTTALILLDIDDFKNVNDHLGHTMGDELLKALSDRARSTLRTSDTLGRLGGDEFAVLIEHVSSSGEASSAADRLIEALQVPFLISGRELSIRASFGIAIVENGDSTVEEFFRDADLAMYEAKRGGKGTYELFDPEMHSRKVEQLTVRSHLDGALERGELEVLYQPQFDLRSRKIVGVEALLRWHHPEWGLVSPATFIPVAEESGAIVEIGKWVLRESTRRVSEWRDRYGIPLSVSVNVSARQFATHDLTETVRRALADSAMPPEDLVLEITETTLLGRDETVLATLDRLDSTGVRLAIDDFGTGYSSLGYLKDLPISILKIDRGFVAPVSEGTEGAALAEAIVRLAQALDLSVLAEGIETEGQAAVLTEMGCDSAQGYLFARPLVASELEEMLLTSWPADKKRPSRSKATPAK